MLPNTTGGQTPTSFTIPSRCAHGVDWSVPCAACGRPYQPAPEVHYHGGPDPITRRLLLLIARCLVATAPHAAGRYQRELEDIEAALGGSDDA